MWRFFKYLLQQFVAVLAWWAIFLASASAAPPGDTNFALRAWYNRNAAHVLEDAQGQQSGPYHNELIVAECETKEGRRNIAQFRVPAGTTRTWLEFIPEQSTAQQQEGSIVELNSDDLSVVRAVGFFNSWLSPEGRHIVVTLYHPKLFAFLATAGACGRNWWEDLPTGTCPPC